MPLLNEAVIFVEKYIIHDRITENHRKCLG